MIMLEYTKLILSKVSFDPQLFVKEYKKAIQWLSPEDANTLLQWCLKNMEEPLVKLIQQML